MFNLTVHGGAGAKGRAHVNLHQPWLQPFIYQNIKTIKLKATSPFLLGFRMDVKHHWLSTNAGLDYNIFDVGEDLSEDDLPFMS